MAEQVVAGVSSTGQSSSTTAPSSAQQSNSQQVDISTLGGNSSTYTWVSPQELEQKTGWSFTKKLPDGTIVRDDEAMKNTNRVWVKKDASTNTATVLVTENVGGGLYRQMPSQAVGLPIESGTSSGDTGQTVGVSQVIGITHDPNNPMNIPKAFIGSPSDLASTGGKLDFIIGVKTDSGQTYSITDKNMTEEGKQSIIAVRNELNTNLDKYYSDVNKAKQTQKEVTQSITRYNELANRNLQGTLSSSESTEMNQLINKIEGYERLGYVTINRPPSLDMTKQGNVFETSQVKPVGTSGGMLMISARGKKGETVASLEEAKLDMWGKEKKALLQDTREAGFLRLNKLGEPLVNIGEAGIKGAYETSNILEAQAKEGNPYAVALTSNIGFISPSNFVRLTGEVVGGTLVGAGSGLLAFGMIPTTIGVPAVKGDFITAGTNLLGITPLAIIPYGINLGLTAYGEASNWKPEVGLSKTITLASEGAGAFLLFKGVENAFGIREAQPVYEVKTNIANMKSPNIEQMFSPIERGSVRDYTTRANEIIDSIIKNKEYPQPTGLKFAEKFVTTKGEKIFGTPKIMAENMMSVIDTSKNIDIVVKKGKLIEVDYGSYKSGFQKSKIESAMYVSRPEVVGERIQMVDTFIGKGTINAEVPLISRTGLIDIMTTGSKELKAVTQANYPYSKGLLPSEAKIITEYRTFFGKEGKTKTFSMKEYTGIDTGALPETKTSYFIQEIIKPTKTSIKAKITKTGDITYKNLKGEIIGKEKGGYTFVTFEAGKVPEIFEGVKITNKGAFEEPIAIAKSKEIKGYETIVFGEKGVIGRFASATKEIKIEDYLPKLKGKEASISMTFGEMKETPFISSKSVTIRDLKAETYEGFKQLPEEINVKKQPSYKDVSNLIKIGNEEYGRKNVQPMKVSKTLRDLQKMYKEEITMQKKDTAEIIGTGKTITKGLEKTETQTIPTQAVAIAVPSKLMAEMFKAKSEVNYKTISAGGMAKPPTAEFYKKPKYKVETGIELKQAQATKQDLAQLFEFKQPEEVTTATKQREQVYQGKLRTETFKYALKLKEFTIPEQDLGFKMKEPSIKIPTFDMGYKVTPSFWLPSKRTFSDEGTGKYKKPKEYRMSWVGTFSAMNILPKAMARGKKHRKVK